MQQAIQQKRAISTVGGIAPSLCVASVTHFQAESLVMTVSDPDPLEGYQLPEDPSEFLRIFYSPIVDWLERSANQEEVLGRRVIVREVPELDLAIGLDRQVADAVGSASGLESLSRPPTEEPSAVEADQDSAVEPSGVVARLGPSWRSDMRHLDDSPSIDPHTQTQQERPEE